MAAAPLSVPAPLDPSPREPRRAPSVRRRARVVGAPSRQAAAPLELPRLSAQQIGEALAAQLEGGDDLVRSHPAAAGRDVLAVWLMLSILRAKGLAAAAGVLLAAALALVERVPGASVARALLLRARTGLDSGSASLPAALRGEVATALDAPGLLRERSTPEQALWTAAEVIDAVEKGEAFAFLAGDQITSAAELLEDDPLRRESAIDAILRVLLEASGRAAVESDPASRRLPSIGTIDAAAAAASAAIEELDPLIPLEEDDGIIGGSRGALGYDHVIESIFALHRGPLSLSAADEARMVMSAALASVRPLPAPLRRAIEDATAVLDGRGGPESDDSPLDATARTARDQLPGGTWSAARWATRDVASLIPVKRRAVALSQLAHAIAAELDHRAAAIQQG